MLRAAGSFFRMARISSRSTVSCSWSDIIDLGDITTARGTEMMLPVWVRLFGALQKPLFNFKLVR